MSLGSSDSENGRVQLSLPALKVDELQDECLELALLPPLWKIVTGYFCLAEQWDRRFVFPSHLNGPWDAGLVFLDIVDTRQMMILRRLLSSISDAPALKKLVIENEDKVRAFLPWTADDSATSGRAVLAAEMCKDDDLNAYRHLRHILHIQNQHQEIAVKCGALQILRHMAIADFHWCDSAVVAAVKSGNYKILEAMKCQALEDAFRGLNVYSDAISENNFKLAKWMSANMSQNSLVVGEYSATIKSPEMLEYLISADCNHLILLGGVARGGTPAMVIRVLKFGVRCEWDFARKTALVAARRIDDNLPVLQLLVAFGFPVPVAEDEMGPKIRTWLRSIPVRK